MKKLKTLIVSMLVLMTVLMINIQASAVTTYTTNVVRRAALLSVEHNGDECFGAQAMGVSRSKNCLYAVKVNKGSTLAALYYFPDITNWGDKRYFLVYGLGHANGMAIDTSYIYIFTGSDFVRIKRSYISGLAAESVINVATNSNCEVLTPKKVNPDESERETTPYVDYISTIFALSRFGATGKFIVHTKVKGIDLTEYDGFRKASIKDGEFVISTEADDTFLVENNILFKSAARQGICYKEGYGLFVCKWYSKGGNLTDEEKKLSNPTKSIILWADIDNGAYTIDNNGYKCYTPDKIRIDMTDCVDSETGLKMYEKFEIESIDFSAKKNMIASFNVNYTETYKTAKNLTSKDYDGIYRIDRVDGSKFTLS